MVTKSSLVVYWTLLVYNEWRLYVAATDRGLCYVGVPDQSLEQFYSWVSSRYPTGSLVQDDERMQIYTLELSEYLQGRRRGFTIPYDVQGTPFQLAVWNALCEIPYGETLAYTDIAQHIQKPTAVRAVGAAIGANPILIIVPCHRVIAKNGALTGYRGGLEMKTKLLKLEQNDLFSESTV